MATIKKYTKKDGTTAYMFNAYLGTDPMTGKQKRTTRRGFTTVKEAKLALSRLQVDIEENGFTKQKNTTFKELYELWYESVYKNTVKESTRVKKTEMFTNHILPAFGKLKIDKISVKYCQKVVNQWCEKLVAYREVKNNVTRVLDYAITLGLLADNPMKKIVMPKRKEVVNDEKIENYFSKDELQIFLDYVKQDLPMKWFVFFRLQAFSGFRKGESLALTWRDIDFKANTISVTKTLARGENNTLIIQTPKTKSSVRTISIDTTTMAILKEWRKKQALDMFKMGFNTNNEKQLVFSTLDNKPINHSNTTNYINKVIKRYDLKPVTVHGLRHTHCSLLFEAGAPIQVVKERLGHSDIQTTMNIYTHVTQKAKEDTAEKFAKYVNF